MTTNDKAGYLGSVIQTQSGSFARLIHGRRSRWSNEMTNEIADSVVFCGVSQNSLRFSDKFDHKKNVVLRKHNLFFGLVSHFCIELRLLDFGSSWYGSIGKMTETWDLPQMTPLSLSAQFAHLKTSSNCQRQRIMSSKNHVVTFSEECFAMFYRKLWFFVC